MKTWQAMALPVLGAFALGCASERSSQRASAATASNDGSVEMHASDWSKAGDLLNTDATRSPENDTGIGGSGSAGMDSTVTDSAGTTHTQSGVGGSGTVTGDKDAALKCLKNAESAIKNGDYAAARKEIDLAEKSLKNL